MGNKETLGDIRCFVLIVVMCSTGVVYTQIQHMEHIKHKHLFVY